MAAFANNIDANFLAVNSLPFNFADIDDWDFIFRFEQIKAFII